MDFCIILMFLDAFPTQPNKKLNSSKEEILHIRLFMRSELSRAHSSALILF